MTPQAKKKTEKRTETALPPKERTIQKRIRKNKNRRRKKKKFKKIRVQLQTPQQSIRPNKGKQQSEIQNSQNCNACDACNLLGFLRCSSEDTLFALPPAMETIWASMVPPCTVSLTHLITVDSSASTATM
jgi:hypothetical protein